MLCKLVKRVQPRAGLFDYTIDCPQMAAKAKPGQFVHVLCGGDTYLRRPISICDVTGGRYLRFVFEVRGKGTEELSHAEVGDTLDILGPLGNGFSTEFSEAPSGAVVLIGGGIGIFPLLNLAKSLPKKPVIMLGFRDKDAAVMTEEFSKTAEAVYVASDDGSIGHKGFVTDMLKSMIDSGMEISRIYTCGPKPMMKIAADLAEEKGIECFVSMEERMGCGVGACVTCTCTMKDGSRKRVCKDGPVFNGAEVDFNG